MKKLYRSTVDRKVCGGVAEYFNIDPTLVRLGMVLATCFSFGTMIFGYFVAAVIIPDR